MEGATELHALLVVFSLSNNLGCFSKAFLLSPRVMGSGDSILQESHVNCCLLSEAEPVCRCSDKSIQ